MEEDSKLNILDSVISENLADISADILEASIDQIIDNEFLKDIPIIGIGMKAFGLSQKVREGIFTKKVLKFLFHLKDIPKNKREEFVKKLEDKKENKRAGETILSILERLDDVNKASIIGRLMRATILNHIGYHDFLRLSNIVDKVFFYDLIELKTKTKFTFEVQDSLYKAGLLSQIFKDNNQWQEYEKKYWGSAKTSSSTLEYKLNNFALALIEFGL